MKYSFSTNAFRKYDIQAAIKAIAALGYSGVEIMCDIPHAYPPLTSAKTRKEIARVVKELGISIANLNAFMLYAIGDTWHPSFIEKEEHKRRQRIEHTINCLYLAKDLEAKSISIEPGGPVIGVDREWAMGAFLEAISELTPIAEKLKVDVLIEPEPDLLIETSGQFLKLMEKVDSPAVKLNFDIGHFYCAFEDPARLVHQLAPYTGHYHLEDIAPSRVHRHLIPGEGAIDLKAVLAAIEYSGYDGFITAELYPYEDRPIEAASQALQYLTNKKE
ncbi:3-dehydroshikimate dehydratase [Sporomusa ovata DSM 2662]|uniref:Putaive isomerase n=1 Tax=Sporomusa ovata TaxID=2378 RepID=A0A0U1L3U6_9FIRM|nr:TIM barrel protein [Sporomusa ovata]EQB25220.1 sugar phosphate isomerase/epimerase [Sporomusa ovata DSM 2662]CQR73783.1 Putaive isomerase [Sporomusa ovata]